MITVTQIRNGEKYLSRHLTANDYYSEGELVTGFWVGEGAERLGLKGDVEPEQFDALRCNRHPGTGQKLTPRQPKVAFHDVTISAPKAFSIAAMVGGDERLLVAFRESVEFTLGKLEEKAAVRVRTGSDVAGEAVRNTGNATVAVFIHDTSRLLDPQVHAHGVFANVSWDEVSGRWLALQPRQMMEATKESLRQEFYRDLAMRTEKLGYKIVWRKEGFGIAGISEELERRFSRRMQQRQEFEDRYRRLFGAEPSKARIEQFIKEGKSAATARFRGEFTAAFGSSPTAAQIREFVKDYRSSHMKRSSRAEVRALHQRMLRWHEWSALEGVVQAARQRQWTSPAPVRDDPDGKTKSSAEAEVKEASKARHQTVRPNRRITASQPVDTAAPKKRRPAKAAFGRSDAIRRMKRGQDLASALKGYPMAMIAKQVRRHARETGYRL